MRKNAAQFAVRSAQQQAAGLRIKPADWNQPRRACRDRVELGSDEIAHARPAALVAHRREHAERLIERDRDVRAGSGVHALAIDPNLAARRVDSVAGLCAPTVNCDDAASDQVVRGASAGYPRLREVFVDPKRVYRSPSLAIDIASLVTDLRNSSLLSVRRKRSRMSSVIS
jgi:hypothetical protein